MAGVKGKSGGARKGAGRKPRERKQPPQGKSNKTKNLFSECKEAQEAWDYIVEHCENSKLELKGARYQAAKNYCDAIMQREKLKADWAACGMATTIYDDRGNLKPHPIMQAINKWSKAINDFAKDLGLDMTIIVIEKQEPSDEEKDKQEMFG